MNNSIAFIIPNGKICKTIENVLLTMNLNFAVYESSMNESISLAKNLINKGTKLIISIGGTATCLRTGTNIPVMEIQYSGLDLLVATKEALQYSKKVAILGFQDITYQALQTVRIFNHNIKIVGLNYDEPVEDQAKRVLQEGIDVIISGAPSVNTAKKYGKIGILINIDERNIIVAINNAMDFLKLQKESEEKLETIQAIVNCSSEGIIGTDKRGRITVINPVAEKIIGVNKNSIYSKFLNKVLKDNNVIDILSNKSKESEKPMSNKKGVVLNKVPVIVGGEVTGAVYSLKEVEEIHKLDQKIRKEILLKGHIARNTFKDIVGNSKIMNKTKKMAEIYASVDSTVLILGETGTGKEMFAQSIHNGSQRNNNPFVAVNCAALPENLLESELFGYVKGAFTGARNEGKAGLFEMAHKGTIFLDEISEISLNMQARLLRVIQEKVVIRIGDDKVIDVDVRIISASNKKLLDLVNEGKFREDLYYRLCVLELTLPSLSERKEDIKYLAERIIEIKNKSLNKNIKGISTELLTQMTEMEWKGNVRQLSNVLERVMVMAEGNYIDEETFYDVYPYRNSIHIKHDHSLDTLHNMEIKLIKEALRMTNGNNAEAAKLLGIDNSTLWRKLKKINL